MYERFLIAMMAAVIYSVGRKGLEDYSRSEAVDDAVDIYAHVKGRLSAMNTAAWDASRKHGRL